MSDSTQQYILRKPLKAFVENDQYDEACYAVVADDGLAWQFMDKESFDELFKPLDIPAIQKQLEEHLASFIVNVTEYVDLCDHAQNAEELNAIRGHFNRCQHEHIAEVLALFGLENKETDK